jgi:UDP-N-acetylglucosamine 2-epimerase
VGARPQFIKAAAVSRALRREHVEILVHTGQHYEARMSEIFFEELGIQKPDYNLEVGSGRHGAQTGAMLEGIERVLIREQPDWVLIYGDTNSTLAGAIAASKVHIPIAHVEAGLRSFNRAMPEEINRVVADHLSSLLLCPSEVAVNNLAAEGITAGVVVVGDVMADALNDAATRARDTILRRLGIADGQFLLATVHRAENTDAPERLQSILMALRECGERVVLPLHPRTRKMLGVESPAPNVTIIEPVGYLEMVALTRSARVVLTDSGGLQKEAYWLSVPCITLRGETEWIETVECGWNTLAGADTAAILTALRNIRRPKSHPPLYGDGNSVARLLAALEAASERLTPVAHSR